MDFKTQTAGVEGLAVLAADALLVVVAGDKLPAGFEGVGALGAALKAAAADGDFQFKPGSVFYAHKIVGVKAARVAFAAAGDASIKGFRKAVAAGLAALKGGGTKHLAVAAVGFADLGAAHAEAVVLAAEEAAYVYRHTKPSAPPAPKLASVSFVAPKALQSVLAAGIATGRGIAAGVAVAREAANRPGNHCTPTWLGHEAKRLGREYESLKVQVLEKKEIEKLGMGSFLAVAQGSEEPPRFIVMQYSGGPKGQAPLVLVGKGITFDTGGISLKPGAEMDEMKFDMGGAASVLGALAAVAELKPKINVVGLIATTENMPDGRAIKPGDVVTSMSGQTIEILNTDAEGRLILCDALTYAERFKPKAVVDIATLTGACVIALGSIRSGLFSADDGLAAELLDAGEEAGDLAWRMPLDDEYDEALKSNFADIPNIAGRAGGAITAAKFLHRFTRKLRWAHLDIAGTAWRSGATKGSTGRPVPLLVHWLLSQAK